MDLLLEANADPDVGRLAGETWSDFGDHSLLVCRTRVSMGFLDAAPKHARGETFKLRASRCVHYAGVRSWPMLVSRMQTVQAPEAPALCFPELDVAPFSIPGSGDGMFTHPESPIPPPISLT